MLPGFLLELYETSQVYKLPDVEFAYWQDDNAPAETVKKADGTWTWPFAPHGLPPIMAWAKNKMHGSLLVPYSSAFRCPRDSFDAIMSEVQRMSETPWEQRSSMAFGRWNIFCAWYYRGHLKLEDGTPAPCPRNYYNDLYYNHSDKLLTVALMRNLTNGTVATSVSLHEQNKYKYLISTDGWAVSSKFDKYMLLGSLLLKAEGLTYAFYYPAIKPFEHYVPIMKKHKDDILDMLEWAKSHDAEAQRIAQNAQSFAMRHLNRQSRLCYMFHLISELSKQMRYQVDCSRRPACIPLIEEIKFLSRFDVTSNRCRYQETLAQYGHVDPDGQPGFSGYEELLRKHKAQPEYILFGRGKS
eukprot:XP_001696812.1 predicted protein [Chlamydomonas reinhardtii]